MSLPALALGLTTTGLLRETADRLSPGTFSIERSPREPEQLAEGLAKQALVAVYTGDEAHSVTRRRIFGDARTVELAVQVVISARVASRFGAATATFEAHAAGADVIFATVHRLFELGTTSPAAGSWGELWLDLVTGFDGDLEKRPFLAITRAGVSLPAMDLSLPCKTLGSPVPKLDNGDFWPRLVAKMRTDPTTSGVADYVAALIAGEDLPAWRVDLARAGLSRAEGDAMGLAPLAGLDEHPELAAAVLKTSRGDVVVPLDQPEEP